MSSQTQPGRYTARHPPTVQAVRFDGRNPEAVAAMLPQRYVVDSSWSDQNEGHLSISWHTWDGFHITSNVRVGMWVALSTKGVLRVHKDEDFVAFYKPQEPTE